MVKAGAPFSAAPREARVAATQALFRGRWSWRWRRADRFPYVYGDHTVVLASGHPPWGRGTHSSAYLSHAVDELALVWRRGRLICAKARWRCGASTYTFRLLDEPDSTVCPLCTVERHPREAGRH